jgi:transposase
MKVEVLTGVERWQRWWYEKKVRLVEETLLPGATVAEVARRHGVAQTVLFAWRRQARAGQLDVAVATPVLMPVSNNAAERALRCIAVGGRNRTFAGSDAGGRRAAAMYTLIEIKLNGVDPAADGQVRGGARSWLPASWSFAEPPSPGSRGRQKSIELLLRCRLEATVARSGEASRAAATLSPPLLLLCWRVRCCGGA